jgi:hypothetical protein
MKDTRFIELVNLYVDRQISPAEQAELELEIQSSPRRRQVYQQYCRMHRATKLVYESFRAHADQPATALRAPATIAHIADRARRRRQRWVYAAGGLAAACLTLVLVRMDTAPASEIPARTVASRPVPVAQVATTPSAPEAARADLGSLRHSVFAEADYAAMIATLRAEQERVLNAQPARLSLFDDGVFEDRGNLTGRGQNQLNTRRQQRANTEFTAFQFQR